VSDLGPGGERAHSQVTQVVGAPHDHVHQEVVATCDVRYTNHLGQRQRPRSEDTDIVGAVASQADRDHGLQPDAKSPGVDVRMEAPKHAQMLQTTKPFGTGGCGDAHCGCEFLVGLPRILRQKCDQLAVYPIEIVQSLAFPNIGRFPLKTDVDSIPWWQNTRSTVGSVVLGPVDLRRCEHA